MGKDPELVANTDVLRAVGKEFEELGRSGDSPLIKARKTLDEADVPSIAFGGLPMSKTLRDSYEEALKNHRNNLDIAKKYIAMTGTALQQVAGAIRKAEDESTM